VKGGAGYIETVREVRASCDVHSKSKGSTSSWEQSEAVMRDPVGSADRVKYIVLCQRSKGEKYIRPLGAAHKHVV
jgi:hypothetical protein